MVVIARWPSKQSGHQSGFHCTYFMNDPDQNALESFGAVFDQIEGK